MVRSKREMRPPSFGQTFPKRQAFSRFVLHKKSKGRRKISQLGEGKGTPVCGVYFIYFFLKKDGFSLKSTIMVQNSSYVNKSVDLTSTNPVCPTFAGEDAGGTPPPPKPQTPCFSRSKSRSVDPREKCLLKCSVVRFH